MTAPRKRPPRRKQSPPTTQATMPSIPPAAPVTPPLLPILPPLPESSAPSTSWPLFDPLVETHGVASGPLVPSVPHPEKHPPLFWRRWAFLASALFNGAFVWAVVATPYLSYAVPMHRHARHMTPLVIQVAINLVFWLALAVATVCDLAVFTGITRRWYHLLLHVALGASLLVALLLGVASLLYSVHLGYGFMEPLCWLLIAALQTSIILSAHDVSAPQPLHPVLWLTGTVQRTTHAARAFRDAWHDRLVTDHH